MQSCRRSFVFPWTQRAEIGPLVRKMHMAGGLHNVVRASGLQSLQYSLQGRTAAMLYNVLRGVMTRLQV